MPNDSQQRFLEVFSDVVASSAFLFVLAFLLVSDIVFADLDLFFKYADHFFAIEALIETLNKLFDLLVTLPDDFDIFGVASMVSRKGD